MHHIPVKPLSLNHAYRGRRFKTPELDRFKRDVALLLPENIIPKGKLAICYRFGVSSKNSDVDNCVKCFQDALADFYEFNDRQIYRITVEKFDVKKGEEFCGFEIMEIKNTD